MTPATAPIISPFAEWDSQVAKAPSSPAPLNGLNGALHRLSCAAQRTKRRLAPSHSALTCSNVLRLLWCENPWYWWHCCLWSAMITPTSPDVSKRVHLG